MKSNITKKSPIAEKRLLGENKVNETKRGNKRLTAKKIIIRKRAALERECKPIQKKILWEKYIWSPENEIKGA